MLPRYARLRKAREFRAVFAARDRSRFPSKALGQSGGTNGRGASEPRGRVVSSESLVLHAKQHRAVQSAPGLLRPLLRFGFSISKKVSKRAHDRNRLKRRLSEIARRDVVPAYAGPSRYDCVVVVRQGALNADSASLRRELHSLLRRAGIHGEPVQAENRT